MSPAKSNLTSKLAPLADKVDFPVVSAPLVRWGQILRTPPSADRLMTDAAAAGRLVPLRRLAAVRSGLVTRANDFFLVDEMPFETVPNRLRLTKRDYRETVAVLDGKDTPHRLAKRHLRRAIKGPDSLLGPRQTTNSTLRLVDITDAPESLRQQRDHDALAYLRRGETVNYNSSPDKLKGGIPAERANVRNRTPFWYSLNVPEPAPGRLVIPEHFHERFIVTALDPDDSGVVIDTLYVIAPFDPEHQAVINAAMNSVLSWYQLELRGRTQHGEGVLKTKLPDIAGVQVLDPTSVTPEELTRLEEAWQPVADRRTLVVQEELKQADRAAFDRIYLEVLGLGEAEAEECRVLLGRELREAMTERKTRTESVAEFKAQRTPRQNASRAIDSFAARIVTSISPYPDPRHLVAAGSPISGSVSVTPFDGLLTVGDGLFDAGTVFAGAEPIATTPGPDAARFVRAVLTIDPQQTVVDVPDDEVLHQVLPRWESAVAEWWAEYLAARDRVTAQVADERMRAAVNARALQLAHASELPAQGQDSAFTGSVRSSARPRARRRRPRP